MSRSPYADQCAPDADRLTPSQPFDANRRLFLKGLTVPAFVSACGGGGSTPGVPAQLGADGSASAPLETAAAQAPVPDLAPEPVPAPIERPINVVHDLPLTHGLHATVGANLEFSRVGESSVIDCYGSLQIVWSQEARFLGARRVANLLREDSFTAGWTMSDEVQKTLLEDAGPCHGRRNVYEFSRTAGRGDLLTCVTSGIRPAQYTFSVWVGANGSATFTISMEGTDGRVLATQTITPPAQELVRMAVVCTLRSGTSLMIRCSSSGPQAKVRLSCPQFEHTTGQNGAPNDYVPRGNPLDAPPWRYANVDGVEYFNTWNAWTLNNGVAVESAVTELISEKVLKGLLVGPTRVNSLYESRDFAASSWTLVNTKTGNSILDSTLLGPASLRMLEETAALGRHRFQQRWRIATPPGDNSMLTMSVHVAPRPGDRRLVTVGFIDKAGVEKKAMVDVVNRQVVKETGNVFKTHITRLGDVLRVSFTDTAGYGVAAPIGFVGLAQSSGEDDYAGTPGEGIHFGGISLERTDHACIYLGDSGTGIAGGTGDDGNSVVFDSAMGQNNWTVSVDCTPLYDSDSRCKTSWSFVWYATKQSNIRWGCAIRPGAYGGAVVEDFIQCPVFDCYGGPDGLGVPQVNTRTGSRQEIFDVANVNHVAPAMETHRWQIALHPEAIDRGSNIAMYVGTKRGVLDSNGTHVVSRVPLQVACRLGYKFSPIDEKCIKHFQVLSFARTWEQMLQNATETA